jgi:hypothetical protein
MLKQIKRLEKRFRVEEEINDQLAENLELLRQLDESLERLRRDPEYSVEWEVQIAKNAVRALVAEGLLGPVDGSSSAKQNEHGGDKCEG